jgi:hypothetical protein
MIKIGSISYAASTIPLEFFHSSYYDVDAKPLTSAASPIPPEFFQSSCWNTKTGSLSFAENPRLLV